MSVSVQPRHLDLSRRPPEHRLHGEQAGFGLGGGEGVGLDAQTGLLHSPGRLDLVGVSQQAEFADTKVAVPQADAPDGHVLVPMRRGITLHDLLTHRAGFVGVPVARQP